MQLFIATLVVKRLSNIENTVTLSQNRFLLMVLEKNESFEGITRGAQNCLIYLFVFTSQTIAIIKDENAVVIY